jgi:PadR family transcriptional regulator, regulatory protein PadR
MKGTYLGEFEEIVLLATGILKHDAYGVAICNEIELQTQRTVNIGAVHTALQRLEEKGYLKSRFGEATNIRGGKRKRIFTLTAFGLKVLNQSQELRSQMWSQVTSSMSAKTLKTKLR